MTTNQAIKLQQLFLQVSEIFGEIAGQEVAEVKAPTNVVDLPVQTETVEVEQQEVVETEPETPSLESLSIAELRKMAKELGLDTKGKKVDIIARIEALNEPVEENVEEVVEEVIETPEVEEVEVEDDDVEDEVLIEDEDDAEEEYEEEEADEDDEEPSDLELLKAELEDYSLEELKEVLESVELSTKGKKQALISRIIQAVEDGIIAYGDDEEEIEVEDDLDELVTDEDEIEVEEVTDEEESDEEESDDEEDYEDEEEEEELTVREQAQAEIEERILEDYENGDLTDKQITKFLNEYSNGTFKTVNKKRSLNKYIEIMTELVDEDGDVVELGEPYYVGDDVAFCCGAELKEVDGDFYCEICGNEYEGE